ncbi:MAG: [protein-PII] uridylyltransferase [Candidatus Rokubacteria bacterium]|nr:[protein-PII] uridylyltransferase [Candidatus Rokubacteria bacterium]
MALELYRRAKRAETRAERADDRRRLRLEFLRDTLATGLGSLKVMHDGGASGLASVQAHARLMDGILQTLFRLASGDASGEGLTPGPVVLVALGGYGRGELHPSSDIDLMVIHDGELTAYVRRLTQEILYTLWDLGLQVGHSLRSLADCVAIARTDFPSRTSMQEARYLAGSRRLFNRFRRVLAENVYRRDFARFLETTLAERDQRYRKHGASPYIGEPNIKESAGGLRDIHTAMWLGATKFGARTLQELCEKGVISAREQRQADEALTFLWRVRNELHFLAGHRNDVLARDLQPRIARRFGYEDGPTMLGVERFMRDYYLHARAIHRVSRRLIARCQEALSRRATAARRHRQEAMADGLVFIEGRLYPADLDTRTFGEDPARLMKVFWHLHRLGCELSSDLERAVEDSLDLVGDGFRASPAVRDLFLDICRNWGRVAPTLREMHELGLLGRYLPEFGALTCLVQYDAYHKFSADQHSLLGVENLEALAPGQSAESEGAAQVFTRIERPDLLMLGMLLHDIGKALGHGHVAKGIPLVQQLTRRLALPAADAATLEFLVAHHLTMSHIAQRRDIHDPKTVDDLAATVRNPQWLGKLYLLTYADMKAVGPGVMTPWQAAILWDLYSLTLARLTGGKRDEPNRTLLTDRVHAAVRDEVSRQAVMGHLAMMSDRYLGGTGVERIAEHLRLVQQLDSSPVVTEVFHHPDLGTSDLVVVTRDLPGLFAVLAGTLAANALNIISAQIHTRADGVAIDTFQVSDPLGEAVTSAAHWSRTLGDLRAVLSGDRRVEDLLAERQQKAFREARPPEAPPKIAIDNQLSDSSTVVEVKSPDRLGLLYLITRTLSASGLDIANARIATEIDQAFDTFYVTDRAGRKITDEAAMLGVREALEDALMKPL